jgi:hypothetical protein
VRGIKEKEYNDSQPFFVTQGGGEKIKAGKKGRIKKVRKKRKLRIYK